MLAEAWGSDIDAARRFGKLRRYAENLQRSNRGMFDVRDHVYDIDLLGEKKIVNNLEAHLGLSIFF